MGTQQSNDWNRIISQIRENECNPTGGGPDIVARPGGELELREPGQSGSTQLSRIPRDVMSGGCA